MLGGFVAALAVVFLYRASKATTKTGRMIG